MWCGGKEVTIEMWRWWWQWENNKNVMVEKGK